ncbi:hypothetical protein IR083_07745 [Dysgonomonas sp. GY75]|uniref:hypothetical protein n=1 Tax=Dysgonomonas sp. GY75 TaxID=2780419 RepID=UPI0018848A05|nr:hypothetical protein [Dysgonomonas sp. GY75]MBF0648710.1 hypothetical protein [Dysgonomonas sp. GY75]
MERTIWLRLGITLQGNKEEIESVIQGDKHTLKDMIGSGKFKADGNSYIPQDMVIEYNGKHNTAFEEDAVSFEL